MKNGGKKLIVVFLVITFLIAGVNYLYSQYREKETPIAEIVEEEEEIFLYGIKVNDHEIVEGTVGKNATLSTLLAPFDISYQIIEEMAKKSKDIFDVKKIAFNKKFTILKSKDSEKPDFFIYEPNVAEFVVFDLNEADVYKEIRPIDSLKVEIGGTITTNLYVDMVQLGITPDLIDQFADLYGWTVDFQKLQKGDQFKVVYTEKSIEGQAIGTNGIESAYFEHKGKEFYAIPFEQNGEISFFDQDGNSFKKSFLREPLKFTRISSRYNLNRFHPVQKRYKPHLGTDYAAPAGTEIRSVGDGVVLEARYTGANGNFVKIKHNGTYTTQYLHMSKIASSVKPGSNIKQGQVIGYVGSTGLATGPHLCFRFWKNGKQVDWLQEKIPPSEPILEANRLAFNQVKMEKMDQLASISVKKEPKKLLAQAK
jgi:murein DD-endopeptidase MepM/ murein hydrolase activator NlpD